MLEENSSRSAGIQEGMYDSCPHDKIDGIYICPCHEIGDAFGQLSEEASYRDVVITHNYLLSLKDLIEETLQSLQA